MICESSVLVLAGLFLDVDPAVAAAVRQSTQALPSFCCRINKSAKNSDGSQSLKEGFMVRSPSLVRMFIQGQAHSEDRKYEGTTVSVWTRQGDGSIQAAIRPARSAGICEADIMAVGQWRFFVPDGSLMELADFLEEKSIPKRGSWEEVEGERRYVLRYTFAWSTKPPSSSNIVLELAPTRNYLPVVQRCELRSVDQTGQPVVQQIQTRVEEFETLSTGQFVPKKCRVTIVRDGTVTYDATTVAADFSERTADFAKFPRFQFPIGSRVFDHLERRAYIVGEGGRQEAILKDGKQVTTLWDQPDKDEVRTPAQERIRAASRLGPTGYVEPFVTGRMLLIVAACVCLVLVVIAWSWRARSRASQ